MKKHVCAVIAILALAAWTWGQSQAPQQPAAQDSQAARDTFVKAYRIGAGDLLEIKVFELEQFDQTVRVSEDGSITLPLIGRVVVEGLTQEGVAGKLTELLAAKYVKKPQITVFIKEYKSKQIAVVGAVDKPGNYELVGRKNLLQMISMAGGFTDKASDEIYVLRQGENGDSVSIPIDLKDLLVNGNQKLNIPIEPNDVINVPIDREIKVFVFGRVTQPGALKFKISEKVTLLKAIAQAGGWAEGAKQSAVVITRKDKSGKETKIRVNVKDILGGKRKDIPLEEGDVVFVPESFW
jgi:polysaccharide export outer membrane protein